MIQATSKIKKLSTLIFAIVINDHRKILVFFNPSLRHSSFKRAGCKPRSLESRSLEDRPESSGNGKYLCPGGLVFCHAVA